MEKKSNPKKWHKFWITIQKIIRNFGLEVKKNGGGLTTAAVRNLEKSSVFNYSKRLLTIVGYRYTAEEKRYRIILSV